MEVQMISKENVKPTSPTSPHLRTFKLSLLDQFVPSPYAPLILFYPMDGNSCSYVSRKLELLKQSLSATLTHFYPLAGKMKDDLSIECNDEGAYYVETRVNCHLNEFLSQPDPLLLHHFLPRDFFEKESTVATYVTNVQANVFECGGIAIGICVSHKVLDGASLSSFLKGWAARTRGCSEAIHPDFISSSLFPANDLWLRDSSVAMWGSLRKRGMCITRRFVFDSTAITSLKSQAACSRVECPSRVEVVSAFLWRCAMAVSEKAHGHRRPSFLSHLVNLRRRMLPPLSENSTGNLLWIAAAHCMADQPIPALNELVGEVRKAISKINDDFVKQLKGEEGKYTMSQSLKEISELGSKDGVDYFGFTSWCNLGYYDVDFGWGNPIWVSSIGLAGSEFMNLVILNDTRLGDGIEAWVTLDEQEMAMLAANAELLKHASLDQSPSAIGNLERP